MEDDFKVRLKQEYEDLQFKLDKLGSFIETNRGFMDLPDIQRTLLIIQKDSMQTYASCLYGRLQYLK